jgi:hypothetical protein
MMKRVSMRTDSSKLSATKLVSRYGVFLFVLALPFAVGCEKEEPPPPLPSAAPAPTPAPQTELKVEEEALPAPSAAPSAAKTGGSGKPAQSLKNCCAALHQNAKSAPPPNNGYLETAASLCDGAVAAGSAMPVAALQAAAKGAGLPSSCY